MAFFHARRALASSLVRALSSSSSSSASLFSLASSRSRVAYDKAVGSVADKDFSKKISKIEEIFKELSKKPSKEPDLVAKGSVYFKGSSKKNSEAMKCLWRLMKGPLFVPGCDFKHWLIIMDLSQLPKRSEEEMVNTYVKTLAEVLGSEEEAKKKIYSVTTERYAGFGAEISEELSVKVEALPGVRMVLPDSYMDVCNKEYGGDLFVDGKVMRRLKKKKQEDEDGENARKMGEEVLYFIYGAEPETSQKPESEIMNSRVSASRS